MVLRRAGDESTVEQRVLTFDMFLFVAGAVLSTLFHWVIVSIRSGNGARKTHAERLLLEGDSFARGADAPVRARAVGAALPTRQGPSSHGR